MDTTKNILQIKWSALKPQIHQHWGRITEDDLAQINGKTEEFVRVLRKRYGYGKVQAEIEISRWLADQGNHPSRANS